MIEYLQDLPDIASTWLGKLGLTGILVAGVKAFFIVWNRIHPKPLTVGEVKRWQFPLFGWLGRRLAIESTAITQAIQIKTQKAQIDRLEQVIRRAGIESGLTVYDDSSSPKQELIPIDSTVIESKPSTSTSTSPDSPPLLTKTSGSGTP